MELKKFFMEIIDFDYTMKGTPVVSALNPDLHVKLLDRTYDTRVQIDVISAYTPYKSLGTMQAISEKNTAQFEALKKKVTELIRALSLSRVTHQGAWLHHLLCFAPSIAYPLPVCHLSDHQLHQLQSTYLGVLCNKIGFTRTYSHSILFRPQKYGGIGAPRPTY